MNKERTEVTHTRGSCLFHTGNQEERDEADPRRPAKELLVGSIGWRHLYAWGQQSNRLKRLSGKEGLNPVGTQDPTPEAHTLLV